MVATDTSARRLQNDRAMELTVCITRERVAHRSGYGTFNTDSRIIGIIPALRQQTTKMAFFETINGIKHDAYRDALALLKPAVRAETNRFLAEDDGLARMALKAGTAVAVYALPTVAPSLMDDCHTANVPLYVLGNGLMNKLIGTGYETAVTVLTIAQKVTATPQELIADPNALVLCGEQIHDPRNVGVLVRTVEATGCTGLLLSSDSADAWSRQAVRSTTGSIFRVPVAVTGNLPALLVSLKPRATVVATSAKNATLLYETNIAARPLILCVGNETRGITSELRNVADAFVRLPMAANGASSLNVTVAAGALLYEAIRQRDFTDAV